MHGVGNACLTLGRGRRALPFGLAGHFVLNSPALHGPRAPRHRYYPQRGDSNKCRVTLVLSGLALLLCVPLQTSTSGIVGTPDECAGQPETERGSRRGDTALQARVGQKSSAKKEKQEVKTKVQGGSESERSRETKKHSLFFEKALRAAPLVVRQWGEQTTLCSSAQGTNKVMVRRRQCVDAFWLLFALKLGSWGLLQSVPSGKFGTLHKCEETVC